MREQILSEEVARRDPIAEFVRNSYHKMYVLGDPPDYEPGPEQTVQAIADAARVAPPTRSSTTSCSRTTAPTC